MSSPHFSTLHLKKSHLVPSRATHRVASVSASKPPRRPARANSDPVSSVPEHPHPVLKRYYTCSDIA